MHHLLWQLPQGLMWHCPDQRGCDANTEVMGMGMMRGDNCWALMDQVEQLPQQLLDLTAA